MMRMERSVVILNLIIGDIGLIRRELIVRKVFLIHCITPR